MSLLALLLIATGSLSGKVSLAGLPPKLANLPVTRDGKVCGTSKTDESLEVKDGGVKNAVVYFLDIPLAKGDKPPKVKLDQQACVFVPHILVTSVGSVVDVVNSDKALHNVRAQLGETKLMNYAMPIQGHVVPTKVKREGIFKVSCDVHPWMRAWALSLPTAFYTVTAEDGTYNIPDIPAGKHRIKIWHERLGEKEFDVEIKAAEVTTQDAEFTPR